MNNNPIHQEGSSLCLGCGLCCNGTLHGNARIAPQEIYFAESLGLTTLIEEGMTAFMLPCPRWQQGCCSVYPIRPNVCGNYRCKLLSSLYQKEVTLEAAQGYVVEVKELIAEIEELIGDCSTSNSIWRRAIRFAERNGYDFESREFFKAHQMVKLKVDSLDWLLTRYFVREQAQEQKVAIAK